MIKKLSSKNKTLLLTTTSIIIFSIVILWIVFINQKEKLKDIEQEYHSNIKKSYNKILERHKNFYEFRLKANIRSKGVKEAFASRDRKELLDLVKDRWDVLREENPYLMIMHFHLPNGESFLRVHKQDKFGDNIAKKRAMVETMHKLKKPLYGFEAGIYMLAYRTFLPIFYKDKYIGAVEFGSRPDQILNEIDYYNNLKGALFVKDDKTIEYKEKSNFKIAEYKLQYSTLKDKTLLNRLPEDCKLDKDLSIKFDDKHYQIYTFDLSDYNGNTSVKVIFFHDVSNIYQEFINTVNKLIFSLAVLLVFSIFAINYGFRNIIDTLELSETKLKKAQSVSHLGIWELDLVKNTLEWSDEVFEIFEIDKNKFEASYEGFVNAIYPDDRKKVSDAYENSLVTKEQYEIVHRLIMPDGRVKWVEEQCSTEFDEDGKALKSMGTIYDITKQKNLENASKEYLDLIDKNVITSSTDIKGNITYVSEAFEKISEYSKDELIGKNHRIIRHPDMKSEVYKELWETISAGKTWKGEIKNKPKYSDHYWVYASISPIYNDMDKITGYTAIRQDITDKKRIEKMSITDALTGMYNRRHFNDLFSKITDHETRENIFINFLIMDIDHFKQYNDTYGHQLGDEALIKVAQAIKSNIKREDDNCFRLGGEEFGMLFYSKTTDDALMFAHRVKDSIEDLHIDHSQNSTSKYVTVSMGLISKEVGNVKNEDEIYRLADELLYEAKESGRNRVCANV